MKKLVAAVFVAAFVGPLLATLLRRRRRPQPRQLDVVCGTCFRDLVEGDAFELKVFDDELGEASETQIFGGGTYMTGYFCGQHRPDGSVPSLG